MIYSNLSPVERRRIKMNSICPICGKEIDQEEFEYIKYRYHKCMNYTFFHRSCLIKSQCVNALEKGVLDAEVEIKEQEETEVSVE